MLSNPIYSFIIPFTIYTIYTWFILKFFITSKMKFYIAKNLFCCPEKCKEMFAKQYLMKSLIWNKEFVTTFSYRKVSFVNKEIVITFLSVFSRYFYLIRTFVRSVRSRRCYHILLSYHYHLLNVPSPSLPYSFTCSLKQCHCCL